MYDVPSIKITAEEPKVIRKKIKDGRHIYHATKF